MARTVRGEGPLDPAVISAVAVSAVALVVLASGVRVIAEHQRGVVLRLGRRGPVLSPGLRYILPLRLDRLVRVDLRSTLLEVPAETLFTADGVPVTVGAAAQVEVLNALLAVTRVIDYRASAVQLVQSALRDAVGRLDLRTLLVNQATVRAEVGRFVDERSEPWGLRVTEVALRGVELPESMRRTMDQQAEIRGRQQTQRMQAEAELAAAQRLAAAAEVLAGQPYAVQLRFLQTLTEVSSEKATVIVVPLPADLVQPFIDLQGRAAAPRGERLRPSSQPPPGASGESAEPGPQQR